MTRPDRIRLAVLLDARDGEAQRHVAQLLHHIDRNWFAPELWVLRGNALVPELRAAVTKVDDFSKAEKATLSALARLAARLRDDKPDLLYAVGGLPNSWGRVVASAEGIRVVSFYRNQMPWHARAFHLFATRIIIDTGTPKAKRPIAIDLKRVVSIGRDRRCQSALPYVRRIETVLREVAAVGTTWAATLDGEVPLELPLRPAIEQSGIEQSAQEKCIERGKFRPDRSLRDVVAATLAVHLPPAEQANGTAVVICPGGGYAAVTIDKEGHDIARWLTTLGIAGLVLKYRLPTGELAENETPRPLDDMTRALALVRAHAGAWRINPRRIGVMGFSAGGHMAAYASAADPQLAFAVLLYPVISMKPQLAHNGSKERLLGPTPSAANIERYSCEELVTAQTCPTLLIHAHNDGSVKVANATTYAQALKRAGVRHDLLLYRRGGHGFGLGVAGGEAAEWPRRFTAWLEGEGLLPRANGDGG